MNALLFAARWVCFGLGLGCFVGLYAAPDVPWTADAPFVGAGVVLLAAWWFIPEGRDRS